MKILFFSPYFYPYISGITTYTLDILVHLAKTHQIKVLTFPHKKNLNKHQTLHQVEIIRIPYLLRVSKGFISLRSIYFFIKYAHTSDLVILNLPNVEGLALAIIAKAFNKPIITIYNCQVDLGSSLQNKFINAIIKLAVSTQLSLSDSIVAHTQDYAKSQSVLSRHLQNITYIPPAVSKKHVDQETSRKFKQLKANSKWIGFAGRMAREKGIEYLIQAIDKINSQHEIKLIFAGPNENAVAGENKYYTHIKSLLNKHDTQYEMLGTLKNGDLGAFYKNIDVLVLPSTNTTEAFGIVQVEAMLLGTPVIASDLQGVRVPIQQTGMGIIVPPKNIDKLAQAIKAITENKNEYIFPDKATQKFRYQSSLNHFGALVESHH